MQFLNHGLHFPLILLVLITISDITTTLKDVRVLVPSAVKRGENANLVCLYDLEDDVLYSVKWYKGKREFFRFVPKAERTLKTFMVAGINVDVVNSNRSHIIIKSMEPLSAGKYSCEISADAPSFHTMIVSSDLEVVDVPKSKPIITEIKQRYVAGEMLRGNCTSPYSKPISNLTWLINDKMPSPMYTQQYQAVKDELKYLESNTIGITLLLNRQFFVNGKLKISCLASIYNLYQESSDKFIELDELPNVLMASSPPAGQNFALQSSAFSPFSSYHELEQKDVQADMSTTSVARCLKLGCFSTYAVFVILVLLLPDLIGKFQ